MRFISTLMKKLGHRFGSETLKIYKGVYIWIDLGHPDPSHIEPLLLTETALLPSNKASLCLRDTVMTSM